VPMDDALGIAEEKKWKSFGDDALDRLIGLK
jgi:hypothetical protein